MIAHVDHDTFTRLILGLGDKVDRGEQATYLDGRSIGVWLIAYATADEVKELSLAHKAEDHTSDLQLEMEHLSIFSRANDDPKDILHSVGIWERNNV